MRYAWTLLITLLALVVAFPVTAEELDWEIAQSERVKKAPDSVTLEYKFGTEGITQYHMTVSGDGKLILPGQNEQAQLRTNSEMTFTQKVMDYQPTDGIWRLQWALEKGTLAIPDFGETRLSLPKMEIEMEKNGAVRSVKGLEKLASTNGLPHDKTMEAILTQLKSLGFPSGPVKAGESWEREYTVSLAEGEPVKVKVQSRLEGFERVHKSDCAKIRTTYEAPFSFVVQKADATGGEGSALVGTEQGDIHTHFAYEDGRIVQSYGTIRVTADMKAVEAKASAETQEKEVVEPTQTEQPEEPAIPAKPTSHNLDVKYDLVMQVMEAQQ